MNRQTNIKSFLDEIPKGWKYDRLKDVVTLRDCRTDEKSEVEDYLELEDIESGTGQILSRRNTLEVESNVTCFKKGDVLFGKLRPYLEKYYFAEFDGKCTGEILAFAPEGIEGHFLRYCVVAPWFVAGCNALAYGAKMPRVNWPKQLAIFDIPFPPRDEQRRIAAYLDKECKGLDDLHRTLEKQIFALEQYRKSLIHECVTGKRRMNKGLLWQRTQ
jgi:type I restriction enzyme S subunit